MKKLTKIIVLLLVLFAGCEGEPSEKPNVKHESVFGTKTEFSIAEAVGWDEDASNDRIKAATIVVAKGVTESPDIMVDSENGIGTTLDIDIAFDMTPDIIFYGDSGVLFEWNDGMFNVVYDANNCTAAAKTFLACMLPRLNVYIEEKAKLMLKESNAVGKKN